MSNLEKSALPEEPESSAGWNVMQHLKGFAARFYRSVVGEPKPKLRRGRGTRKLPPVAAAVSYSGVQNAIAEEQQEQRAAEVNLSDIVHAASRGVPAEIGDPEAGSPDKRSFNAVWDASEIPGEASEEKDGD